MAARVTPTPPGPVRRLIGQLVLIAAIAAAVILVYRVLDHLDRAPRTQDGFLFADQVAMAPDVSGRLIAVPIKENQAVAVGDLLAEIDPAPYALRVREARAALATVKAQLALTTRQVAAQASGADAAQTQIQRAEAQRSLAHDTLNRIMPLLDKGYVTEQQVAEAKTNEKAADAALLAATQQARQARQSVGDTESLLAQLESAEARLALAERDLRNTKITAPFDGLIVGLDRAEGAYAVAGQPLFSLIKTRDWYAVGNFRETELPRIAPGDPVTVWLLSDDNHPIQGHVESLGRGIRPEDGPGPYLPTVGRTLNWVIVAQRFPVRVHLDAPPPAAMRVGATVSLVVHHAARP